MSRPAINPIKDIPVIVRGIKKRAYQQFILNSKSPKQIVFILGCQRSGTTMLGRCFRKDFRTKVYGELGLAVGRNQVPGQHNDARRLKTYSEIEQILAKEKASLLIAKPIVESQNALDLLTHFPGSKIIWVYRNYKDVANSSLKKFGTESTKKNLTPIINPEIKPGWAAENASEQTRQIVATYFSEDTPIYDAKVLFWYVRNILFFELKLHENPDVLLCKYEDFVTNPAQIMKNIYSFFGYEYPGDHLVAEIHSQSVKLGKDIELNQELETLCLKLLQKMDRVKALSLQAG